MIKELRYSDPQVDIMESSAQRNLMHCGVGSGKSHLIGDISLHYAIHHPDVRGFIGANSYSQLSKSTLDKVFKVWADRGLKRGVHYVVDRIPPKEFKQIGEQLKSYENTITFNNGATIFVASLDKYHLIDGTEFGWAMLDETKDTKEEAVKEVIVARLRQPGMWVDKMGTTFKKAGPGRKGYNPLYIFTSPAKSKWLMKWFDLDKHAEAIERVIKQEGNYFRHRDFVKDQLVVIASTYHNKQNLSDGFIERLLSDLGGNKNLIDMMIYGSPFAKVGGEFYSAFQRLQHVKSFSPWANEPVHLAFDFNLVPYITCTCWQMKFDNENKKFIVRCFKEYCLQSPKNNAESLSKEIKKTIPDLLKKGVFIYGDYSGKTDDTVNEDVRNEFDMIEKVLKPFLHNYSNRVTRNALHVRRRDFLNKIFNSGFNIEIQIDQSCEELIADLEFVRESAKGGKMKEKITVEGRTYEEHGHTSDSMDYFFCGAFENLFNP